MPSALKLGCKHQRQRQAQKKRKKHTTFIPVGFTATPLCLPSFLPPKPSIHSLKALGNPLQNERDHSHPNLNNPSSVSFSSIFILLSLFFLSYLPFLLHIFLLVFFLHKHMSLLHFSHLHSRKPPQSVSNFPSSINTPLFMRSKAGHIYPFA